MEEEEGDGAVVVLEDDGDGPELESEGVRAGLELEGGRVFEEDGAGAAPEEGVITSNPRKRKKFGPAKPSDPAVTKSDLNVPLG